MVTIRDAIERYRSAAIRADTLGWRSYYLGMIELTLGKDCPFTGHAFMVRNPAAMAWLDEVQS